MSSHSPTDSPLAAILRGDAPGTVIDRDDARRLAIITSLEPEAAVHWLVLPFEAGQSTEELEQTDRERFLELLDYAITQAKAHAEDHPALGNGFTIKIHFGSYETVPHAKLHILSVE